MQGEFFRSGPRHPKLLALRGLNSGALIAESYGGWTRWRAKGERLCFRRRGFPHSKAVFTRKKGVPRGGLRPLKNQFLSKKVLGPCLRAKGSPTQLILPAKCDFSQASQGKLQFFGRICFRMAILPVSHGENQSRFLGRGCDEAFFREKKRVFQ